jgi:hypothetical protein
MSAEAQKIDITLTTNRPPKNKNGRKTLLVVIISVIVILLFIAARMWQYEKGNESCSTVIAEKMNLVRKVSEKDGVAVFEHVAEIPFGSEVYYRAVVGDNSSIQQGDMSYYSCVAYRMRGQYFECENNCYIELSNPSSDLGYTFSLETYLAIFPVKKAQALPSSLKKSIVGKFEDRCHFTQDPNLIERSIVNADLNGDGYDDYAVVLTSIGGDSYNHVCVFCYNPDLRSYYNTYDSHYLPRTITLFEKNTLVYMGGETKVAAPAQGIFEEIIYPDTEPHKKVAVIYDPSGGRFQSFIQAPKSELEPAVNETEYEEYYDESEESDEGSHIPFAVENVVSEAPEY